MFDRLTRSWGLVKASAAVLMQDKALMAFPVISSIATVVVAICFLLPMFGLGALDGLSHSRNAPIHLGYLLAVFFFYVSQYFVIFFFNAALVGAAMMRLDGKEAGVSEGLELAWSRVGAIFGYAIIAATVGLILRAIEERVGFLGKIITGLIGLAWTLATAMVVPVLVAQKVGPLDAVMESAELLKRTWGEEVIGQGGMGAAFTLIQLGIIVGFIILGILAALTHSVALVIMVCVLGVLAVIFTALIHATLSGIYSAALYRYATQQGGVSGFDTRALQNAFAPKA